MNLKTGILAVGALLIFAAPFFSVRSATAMRVPAAPTCDEVYVIQSNDWLSKISEKFLGNRDLYPAIVSATNQQHQTDPSFPQIVDANRIEAGWRLCIPAADAAPQIIANVNTVVPLQLAPPAVLPTEYTVDNFLAEHTFPPGVNADWFLSVPEPVAKYPVLPEHQARRDAYGYRSNYLWNENLSEKYYLTSGIFDAIPPDVYLFDAPTDSVLPRYRYPPNVTLPTGLTTNQYGWRGVPIELHKPERTIRIAALGASTTVGGHSLKSSYPEFLQHWLNLWARDSGQNVRFEVINAGREGLNSSDIAAVMHFEVLPLDVDYVIYYEGSNQFHPEQVVTFPPEYQMGKPPAGVIPNFANVESDDKTLLDYLSEYSALAARARSIVEQFLVTGEEPPKPAQTFFLAAGQDEMHPSRAALDNALDLRRILIHLDQIKADADANGVQMVMTTFNWFVYDDMVLDPQRNRNLYGYINRVYWPISYTNMRRAADYQNRVFRMWAEQSRVPIIDVAGIMPKQADLFDDAIHNKYLGTRIRAWTIFEQLLPLLRQDIESGKLPRPARFNYTHHPTINDTVIVHPLPVSGQ